MIFNAIRGMITPFTEEEQARFPTWTAEEKALPCKSPKFLKPPIKKKEILPLHDMNIPHIDGASCNGEDLQTPAEDFTVLKQTKKREEQKHKVPASLKQVPKGKEFRSKSGMSKIYVNGEAGGSVGPHSHGRVNGTSYSNERVNGTSYSNGRGNGTPYKNGRSNGTVAPNYHKGQNYDNTVVLSQSGHVIDKEEPYRTIIRIN